MKWLVVLIIAIGEIVAAGAQVHGRAQSPGFVVYDGTSYAHKPDLTRYGLKKITVLYSGSLWKNSEDRLSIPDPGLLGTLAAQANAAADIAVIDIESWPITGPPPRVSDSIQKYESTLRLFKRSEPSLRVGYYGFPARNYTASMLGSNSPQYKSWQALNDGLRSIALLSDALFPSIYTLSNDQKDWPKYAIAQMKEAHRIGPGKPVYVFLWPQFYQVGKIIDYLPGDYWRMELETALQHADGVVIWGGTGQTWDNKAPWWRETQAFLKEIRSQK